MKAISTIFLYVLFVMLALFVGVPALIVAAIAGTLLAVGGVTCMLLTWVLTGMLLIVSFFWAILRP